MSLWSWLHRLNLWWHPQMTDTFQEQTLAQHISHTEVILHLRNYTSCFIMMQWSYKHKNTVCKNHVACLKTIFWSPYVEGCWGYVGSGFHATRKPTPRDLAFLSPNGAACTWVCAPGRKNLLCIVWCGRWSKSRTILANSQACLLTLESAREVGPTITVPNSMPKTAIRTHSLSANEVQICQEQNIWTKCLIEVRQNGSIWPEQSKQEFKYPKLWPVDYVLQMTNMSYLLSSSSGGPACAVLNSL